MLTVKVLLDSIEKVKKFSSAVSKIAVDCELVEGARIVDAKSIMGIFSMDLEKPMELQIHTDDRGVLKPLEPFFAEKP